MSRRRPSFSVLAACAAALLLPAEPVTGQRGPAPAPLPPGADSVWSEIVAEWEAALAEQGVVGASLALVRDGDLVRMETRGLADRSEARPVDRSTIYHWASITKTLTGIAVMQLRDRGLIRLDDPIVRYVPELREVHNEFGSMEDITIRQLMSHSAGFRAATWPWGGDKPWHPHEPTEWSQLVAMMPYTEILFQPGSRFSYSNPGIVFLGRMIERVTGDVYEAYVDKNIFRPLGMRRAYFDGTPWGLRRFRSNHYFVNGEDVEEGGLDFNTGITVSNGGLNAPVTDMARYLAFLMGAPAEGSDYDAVLSRNSLREMWHPVVPVREDHPLGTGSMGLTFFLYDQPDGTRVVGHTGGQRAFISSIYVDPDARVGAITAFNTLGRDGSPPDTRAIQTAITRRIVTELFPLFRAKDGEGSGGRAAPAGAASGR